MRCDRTPHQLYCGIDWHARTLDVGLLHGAGEILGHRHMQAAPAPVRQAMAPDREARVGCLEGLFPGYWLADRCAPEGMPVVLGHARSLKALPGDTAKHERIDAHQSAVRLRGGLLPQASGDPAQRRATRDLLRPRRPRLRHGAGLLAHLHHPTRP